ncbi:MAG: SLOG family protein [Acutalibacter sp.]
MERKSSCCFTGHRRIPEQEMLWLRRRLREEIVALVEEKGITTFLAGGALGFDTIAAQEVLRARGERYPGLKLELVLPYVGQEEQWSQRDASIYRAMLRQADRVVYIAGRYTQGCMFQRNRYLVEHSAYCLCYQKRGRGGTAYTVRYANSQGLAVRNLAIQPWQE